MAVRRSRPKGEVLLRPSLRSELYRHHPRQTLADVVGVQARQPAGALVHLENGQLARALAGAENVAAVRIDLERTRRLLRRRLAQRRQLAPRVDGEPGQAVVAAVGHPDELAAWMYLHLGRRV